ncbi:hypothetical protein ACF0H5_024455 [Mactra antiquata]
MRLGILIVGLTWISVVRTQGPIHAERCLYRPTSGLLPSSFTNPLPDTFLDVDFVDNSAAGGEDTTVTMGKPVQVFSSNTQTTIKIFDYGTVSIQVASGSQIGVVNNYAYDFDDVTQSYLYALWVENDSDLEYRFDYRHLKRTDLLDGDLITHNLFCQLQMIEGMINGCDEDRTGSDRNHGKIELDEALVITWKITDTAPATDVDYYFQAIIANGIDKGNNNEDETYVIFKYDNVQGLLDDYTDTRIGFINGLFSDVNDLEYAAVCSSNADLHQKSNCRYNGRTHGGTSLSNTCAFDAADFAAECASTDPDTRRNYQNNCRPNRKPVATCTEDIVCYLEDDETSWKMQVVLYNNDRMVHFENTGYHFVDVDSLGSTPEPIDDVSCKGQFNNIASPGVFYMEETINDPSNPKCGRKNNGGDELEFALYTYNINEPDEHFFAYDNSIVLHGKCEPGDLPPTIKKSLTLGGIDTHTISEVNGRHIEAFFSLFKGYDKDNLNQLVSADAAVIFGTVLFYGAALNYGDRDYIPYVEPYGLYVENCWVSNDAEFRDEPGTWYTRTVVSNGCPAEVIGTKKALVPDEGFMEREWYTFAEAGTNLYNFVQTSGAFTAAWYGPGPSKDLYLRISVGFCYNIDFYDESKCSDACGNVDVDFTGDSALRKKRDVEEETIVETHIRIIEEPEEGKQEDLCVSNTAALSTLVALLVLLIMAVLITILMFVKLQARQKK